MKMKNFKNLKTTDFDDTIGFDREGYDGVDPENINIMSTGDIDYDVSQVRIIQNTRLVIKLSECQLFCAGNSKEIDKIPDIFFKKREFINYKKFK